ncbi:hypothetical protein FEAC_14140 [Ferrimicrobium acidiphilum DSM 19497]|uniref:Uncharacterized protein n=1 Tax=Ferrimicrobium acidiphilum DSM 19497 TaxID=1121877 RepID=A0A0D8FU22_9ACTN|nr:hypothetical protein FEAC_14140 [Ferrimicrobium acidiphilum DSM 19497]
MLPEALGPKHKTSTYLDVYLAILEAQLEHL